ncbi:MAG: copper resistance protein B [Alphaproteobacteria bacterium]|nr:MAG: copper resistance protein B [Caulobacteraceae bacterium]TPW07596.1 MAG: copper resistance protein B [Alphaproteobacteria bacterium]
MRTLALSAAFVIVVVSPAIAQSMPDIPDMQDMGHSAHLRPPPPPSPAGTQPQRQTPPAREAAPAQQSSETVAPPGDTQSMGHGAMDHATMLDATAEESVGNEPAPVPPADHPADAFFDPATMQAARDQLRREHGGTLTSRVMLNLAEYQPRDGEDGYRWEGEARYGGDIHRFVLRTEGEGGVDTGLEAAELQALYSRAVTPYFDLQVGIRQDFEPTPQRTYATVGFEGLAPYWFDVQGALFLSGHGDVLGRAEGTYDLRLMQRLILQPRAEMNLAAQDIPEIGIGSGVSNLELGVRLRYEIRRNFAPYVGISYDEKFGDTADFARAAGEDPSRASLVFGLRAWF